MGRLPYTVNTQQALAYQAASGSTSQPNGDTASSNKASTSASVLTSVPSTSSSRAKDAPTLWANKRFDPDDEALPVVEERFITDDDDDDVLPRLPSLYPGPIRVIDQHGNEVDYSSTIEVITGREHPYSTEDEDDEDELEDDDDEELENEFHDGELVHEPTEREIARASRTAHNLYDRYRASRNLTATDIDEASRGAAESEASYSEYSEPAHGNQGYYDYDASPREGIDSDDLEHDPDETGNIAIDRRTTPGLADDFSPSAGVFHTHTLPFSLPNMGEMQMQRRASNNLIREATSPSTISVSSAVPRAVAW